jgi:hypothetical protein
VNDYPTGRILRDAKLYEIGAGVLLLLFGRCKAGFVCSKALPLAAKTLHCVVVLGNWCCGKQDARCGCPCAVVIEKGVGIRVVGSLYRLGWAACIHWGFIISSHPAMLVVCCLRCTGTSEIRRMLIGRELFKLTEATMGS